MALPTENDLGLSGLDQEKIDSARQAGWSDPEIQQYWGRRSQAGVQDVQPPMMGRAEHLEEKNINRNEGESFFPRLMASFKSTPQDRYNFWKQYRGEHNVTLTPAGEILVRGGRGWKPIDEKGISFADLADLAGDVPEVAGMMIGGRPGPKFGEMLLKSGAGAGLGNIVKQGISAILPGEETMSAGKRLWETTKATVGGAASQVLAPVLGATINPAKVGTQYLRNRLERLQQGDIAKEGSDLMNRTGFPLDLAEETQDPMLKMIAGFAYRNAFGQTQHALNQKGKDSAALAMLQRLSGELGKEGGFADQPLGEAAAQAAGKSLADVQSGLKNASDLYFRFLQRARGTQPIPVNNYRAKLLSQADYYASMGTRDGQTLSRELRAAANDMQTEAGGHPGSLGPGSLNARAIQEHLENLGSATWGKEGPKIFRNMRNFGKTRELKDLHGALRQDLLDAENAGGPSKAPAMLLREARQKWESEQSALATLQDLPLLRFMESKGMLGKALDEQGMVGHEHITKHLIEGMRSGRIAPTEISNMVKVMSAVNSDFPHRLAQGLLNHAVEAGRAAGRDRPAQFSYEAAYKALPSPEHLQAIYKDIWNPEHKTTGIRVASEIGDLMKAIERSNVSGQGIPQAPGSTLINIASQTMYGDAKAAAKNALSHVFLPKRVAAFMSDPKIRDAMLRELDAGEAKGFSAKWLRDIYPGLVYEGGANASRTSQQNTGR